MRKSKLLSKPLKLVGLMFGFIGAVLLAYSVKVIDPGMDLTHSTVIEEHLWWGIILLAVGFGFQLLGVCLEE